MTAPIVPLEPVFRNFAVDGAFLDGAPYGNGHINDTYAVRTRARDGAVVRHILQRVNHHVFKNVPGVMENIVRVTRHLRARFAALPGRDPDRETLTVIPTRSGQDFHRDDAGNFWRVYPFIENSRTVEVVERPEQAAAAGRAFGEFQKLLADLPEPRLHDTIPDFHHTPRRIARLEQAIALDAHGRAAGAREEIAAVLDRKAAAATFTDALADGALPLRITHNDTKINNVLLDAAADRGVCVIDLDTVMPGTVLYDFGDQVRTSTCTGTEDERDLDAVTFRLDLFAALVRGYTDAARDFLTPAEWHHLAFSGRLITLEIGVRFLTDYLEGDHYFKTHRPGHNLQRCRTQLRRLYAMEAAAAGMERIVAECRAPQPQPAGAVP